MYRRGRSLVDYENANKALDKARAKNKDVLQAETSQQLSCQKFEKISESAKQGTIFPSAHQNAMLASTEDFCVPDECYREDLHKVCLPFKIQN